MAIGLSTYAFFWRMSSRVPDSMGLEAMLDHTAESGATVFQICDYPAVKTLSYAELEKLRQRAEDLSIQLELGTRGLETYEQVKTSTLLEVVDAIDSQALGICLDPGNCVAVLEHPCDVIRHDGTTRGEPAHQGFCLCTPEWLGWVYLFRQPARHRVARLRPPAKSGSS